MTSFKAERNKGAFCEALALLCEEGEGLGLDRAKRFIAANWEWISGGVTMVSETALHLAAKAGSATMVKALIESGADIEALTVADETPLMSACEAGPGALGAIKELLAAGACASGESLVCKGAINRVARRGGCRPVEESAQMFAELMRAGAPVEKAWEDLTSVLSNKGDQSLKEGLIRGLVAAGAHVDLKDDRGETALLRACAWCDNAAETRQAEFLLSRGASPNELAGEGSSMLRLCAQSGRLGPRPAECDELLVKLLEGGADPWMRERDGKSVAELARDESSRLSKNPSARALILAWVERAELSNEAEGCKPGETKKRGLSL